VATIARCDVEQQKAFDRNWDGHQDVLAARMAAVFDAQRCDARP
jgi:hypothetical protein